MKYRKKPVVIEATQWHQYGDHPMVTVYNYQRSGSSPYAASVCFNCNHEVHMRLGDEVLHTHGWIETLEGGHVVCPGDWIITGVKGEHYPCKPDIFAATYELVGAQDE